jgi:hypothetical protein
MAGFQFNNVRPDTRPNVRLVRTSEIYGLRDAGSSWCWCPKQTLDEARDLLEGQIVGNLFRAQSPCRYVRNLHSAGMLKVPRPSLVAVSPHEKASV